MSTAQSEKASRYGAQGAKTFDNAISNTSPDDIPALVQRLRRVFASDVTTSLSWRKQQLSNLKLMLVECEPELCAAMKADLHKSEFEGCSTELSLVRNECDYFLAHLDTLSAPSYTESSALNVPAWSYTVQDPLGVTLIMGAWNYPCQLSLAPLVGAIAGGNCAILKPGSYAVAVSHCLAQCVAKYLDAQAIVVVEGNRDMTSALLKEKFDLIFFTGSGFVGKIVAAAAAKHLTPTVLELGGKSPVVVDKSADLAHAAARIVWGAFLNSGQTCVRPDFVLMHCDIADALLAQIKKHIVQFYGENAQETPWFGRCINAKAFQRLQGLVEDGRAQIVFGGDTDEKDKFVSPTVFDYGADVKAFGASRIMRDEIFGPLLPCVSYGDTGEAIEFIRALPTGKPLAMYVFGSEATFVAEMRSRTSSGGLCVNDVIMHLANDELPFGGVGNSGMGAYHGRHSFEAFTHKKSVLEKSARLDESVLFRGLIQMRFPPYSPMAQWVVKTFGTYKAGNALNVPVRFFKKWWLMALMAMAMYVMGFRIRRE